MSIIKKWPLFIVHIRHSLESKKQGIPYLEVMLVCDLVTAPIDKFFLTKVNNGDFH